MFAMEVDVRGRAENEKLWFLSRASEKVADPRGVVAKGAV